MGCCNSKVKVAPGLYCSIPASERGLTLKQLGDVYSEVETHHEEWRAAERDGGELLELSVEEINHYHCCDNWIAPKTMPFDCSYVELVAEQASEQMPAWFISHAWADPMCSFVQCVQEHARLHHLPESSAIWASAYANNQHNLAGELSDGPSNSSFYKAMELSVGTLLIVDSEGRAYTRIWCGYEVILTLCTPGKKFEIATYIPQVKITTSPRSNFEIGELLDGADGELSAPSSPLPALSRVPSNTHDVRGAEGALSRVPSNVHLPDREDVHGWFTGAVQPTERTEDMSNPGSGVGVGGVGIGSEGGWFTGSVQERAERGWFRGSVQERAEKCPVVIITDGPTAEDEEQGVLQQWNDQGGKYAHKAARELHFPPELVSKALEIQLQNSAASVEADKTQILNSIVGSSNLDDKPPEQHERYDDMNKTLRWRVGVACLEAVEHMDQMALGCSQRVLSERLLSDDGEPERVNMVPVYARISSALEAQGKYPLAVQFRQRLQAICERIQGPDHPSTGIGLSNLGMRMYKMGQPEDALPLLKRALAISEKAQGAEHADTGIDLNNLGNLLKKMERHKEALPLLKRALAISEEVHGLEHPTTAIRLGNLGNLLKSKKMGLQQEEAVVLFKRALTISEKVYGPVHPSTGIDLNNLGKLFAKMGQWEEALPLLERDLAIAETVLGLEHPKTGIKLNNLGVLLAEMGKAEEAVPFFERDMAISMTELGPEHPCTVSTAENLAAVAKLSRASGLARSLTTILSTHEVARSKAAKKLAPKLDPIEETRDQRKQRRRSSCQAQKPEGWFKGKVNETENQTERRSSKAERRGSKAERRKSKAERRGSKTERRGSEAEKPEQRASLPGGWFKGDVNGTKTSKRRKSLIVRPGGWFKKYRGDSSESE